MLEMEPGSPVCMTSTLPTKSCGSGPDPISFSWWRQRRALRTASEKLRNRSSFCTNVVYTSPGSRVNRYISRLLEARQTELEMADLDFLTLKYKQAERERKVGDRLQCTPLPWAPLVSGGLCVSVDMAS